MMIDAQLEAARGLPDTAIKTTWPDLSPVRGCSIAKEGALRAWLAGAAPADRFVYAIGEFLPNRESDPLRRLATALQLHGLVTFAQMRVPTTAGRHETRYLAIRTALALPKKAG